MRIIFMQILFYDKYFTKIYPNLASFHRFLSLSRWSHLKLRVILSKEAVKDLSSPKLKISRAQFLLFSIFHTFGTLKKL